MSASYNLKICSFFVILAVARGGLNPVVLIPGDGGSQVEAKLNKSASVHYICEKTTSDFFNIWLNMELLVPLVIDCWIDNIKLIYDNATRTTRNNDGVEIRIPGFGGTETVEWLDPSHASAGAYFNSIAKTLVSLGHERNKTMKGAPYDFRKAPNENQQFFTDLKALIEQTYTENNNQPVIIIAHSMGGPMSLFFLNQQTQDWKDKYIRSLVTLSGAWGGSMKAVKVYAIGDDLGSYVLRESVMREEQITSPSLAWLLPSKLFWKPDEVLVQTSRKNFSLNNLEEFFQAINFPNGWEMRKDTEKYQLDYRPPGVEVHCLYGVGVDTVERLFYKPGTWLDGYPTLINGDGDGTVNRRSLEGCLHWESLQKQKVYSKQLPKVDHMQILNNKDVLSYIANLINDV
ncbi:phospholipase A2 group XV [Tribolium castaneum]|uniref:Group XV phospholipase A2-like Protein n=2 Tax=Tribolium castaneum TaxID=7070 RepID=D6WM55_TRICA|nr:PREDICTED: group XV phospholipase A2 [Tribolium castaneum]EFA04227.1 Group XV phospholipase A2-like Protein [Tribolium castaneum]|eukprot:XP_015835827.1 PREDICTED: group XV phospholipase A2 [Tribolium castaneum]